MGDITFKGFRCERCGHIWAPRQALDSTDPLQRPKVCPKCKSAWWDVPRKKQSGDGKAKSGTAKKAGA